MMLKYAPLRPEKSFRLNGSTKSLEMGVVGMTCAACVRRVENGIRKVPSVVDASVNLATERVSVEFSHKPSVDNVNSIRDAIEKLGYHAVALDTLKPSDTEQRNDAETTQLWSLFVGAAAFTVPLVMISMVPMFFEGVMNAMMQMTSMEHWNWVMLSLTIPVQFWFGRRFLRHGVNSLFSKSPDMNSLVLLGTMSAFLFSAAVTIAPNWIPESSRHVYFEASAVVITLVLLGKYLETKSRHQASDAMKLLLNLVPKTAMVIRDGQSRSVAVDEVLPGDIVELMPGSAIAVDGIVVNGSTYIDESMVTGESLPVAKSAGDQVVAGTINGTGSIQFRATAVGAETTLAKIVAFVETAQASKPRIQGIADRVVAYFVPFVLVIAMSTALAWLLIIPNGTIGQALVHSVAVLIVACPCAMGLAVPTSVMVGTGKAAQQGILFRSTESIEYLSDVSTIAFDKTGTLTVGKPKLLSFRVLDSFDRDNLLAQIAMVEKRSEHPLATAIIEAASVVVPLDSSLEVTEFNAVAGSGVVGRLSNGDQLGVGSANFMRELGIDVSSMSMHAEQASQEGNGFFFAAVNGDVAALMVVADPIKPSTPAAILKLKKDHFEVALISGDNSKTAIAVAQKCGIPIGSVYAEVRPNDKANIIKSLKAGNRRVAFVGDGLNDASALAVADVGIAMGTGTDLAIESADVIAMSGDIEGVPRAIRLSRSIMLNIKQNLAWAFGYNILLIPIATGLLQPWLGLSLSPVVAGLAMSLSSLFVVTNALRLKGWK